MKKKWLSGFLALVLVLTVLPVGAWAAEAQTVVHASTTEELRAALQSNTKIILEGKDYKMAATYDTLDLYNMQNVTIQGTAGTRLLGYIPKEEDRDPRGNGSSPWGNIIRIGYSDNIVLQDLAIGYDKLPTDAKDAVYPAVRMDGKFSVTMINCEIFGAACGLELGTEEDTDGTFRMENSTIRDCFNSIIEENCMKAGTAIFTNCTFSGNGYGGNENLTKYSFHGYGFEEEAIAVFTNCVFSNNKNPHRERVSPGDDTEIGPFGVYNNCTFEGNAWAEVPSSTPASTPSKTPAKTPAADKTPASTPASGFSDVPDDYWALKEIAWINGLGIMNGVGGGKFDPGANVSRQQSWMVLARLAGVNPASMAEAQEWVTENVLSSGENAAAPLIRQDLVSMLYSYAGKKKIRGPAMADLKAFPDKPRGGDYEMWAMSWAVGSGIISGTSDGRLDPGGKITRAQFAVIMNRFYKNIVNARPSL